MYESLKHKYSWGDSVSKTKIKKDKILLPAKDGKVDYSIMKTFISAIQKLVTKDVGLYRQFENQSDKKHYFKRLIELWKVGTKLGTNFCKNAEALINKGL